MDPVPAQAAAQAPAHLTHLLFPSNLHVSMDFIQKQQDDGGMHLNAMQHSVGFKTMTDVHCWDFF